MDWSFAEDAVRDRGCISQYCTDETFWYNEWANNTINPKKTMNEVIPYMSFNDTGLWHFRKNFMDQRIPEKFK